METVNLLYALLPVTRATAIRLALSFKFWNFLISEPFSFISLIRELVILLHSTFRNASLGVKTCQSCRHGKGCIVPSPKGSLLALLSKTSSSDLRPRFPSNRTIV
ncbi:hypothetical protein Pdw03_4297 [Penicillium digitatum]|uniref:Uncharacterized protein n=1 Tax=Penicillium digitatum TaxID=36651 RepID=A0A7T6XHV8_PENDI|nr:hypothetical protein Pdw03_4297 [Penicillium digitatum]